MTTPKISIVIVVHQESPCFHLVLNQLRLQTAASKLECIVVTAGGGITETAFPSGKLHGLASIRIVSLDAIESAGQAKAAGVAAAAAPLVAFIEDHSLPEKNWAESLIKAHEKGKYAAVGSVVCNANPETARSWGCFLVYYGQYMFARPEPQHLPANHSSYRRDLLLTYGPQLAAMLDAEYVLHQDLLKKGFILFQEPAAIACHVNHSRLRPSLEEYLYASRVFATERSFYWKATKRAVYALGSFLLPWIRTFRIATGLSACDLNPAILAKALPHIFLILCAGAAGEFLGYASGCGDAKEELNRFESQRCRVITEKDIESAKLTLQSR